MMKKYLVLLLATMALTFAVSCSKSISDPTIFESGSTSDEVIEDLKDELESELGNVSGLDEYLLVLDEDEGEGITATHTIMYFFNSSMTSVKAAYSTTYNGKYTGDDEEVLEASGSYTYDNFVVVQVLEAGDLREVSDATEVKYWNTEDTVDFESKGYDLYKMTRTESKYRYASGMYSDATKSAWVDEYEEYEEYYLIKISGNKAYIIDLSEREGYYEVDTDLDSPHEYYTYTKQ